MRIYGFDSYGGPEVQRFLEVPDPTSAEGTPGGVAIETTAVGLNPGDIKVRSGQRQGAFPVESPMAMGREAAGRVISSDPSTGLSAGDRVFGSCLAGVGALGEVTILDATSTTPIPDAVEDFQAACLPVAAGTAWDALHELNAGDPNAEKPQRVLVLGAGGGVGTFAVQMARYLGCSVVGVASSAKKLLVERLGAHHVDYAEFLNQSVNQSIEVTREVAREIIGPVDAIVDAAGGDSLRILAGLAPEGAIRSAAGTRQRAGRAGNTAASNTRSLRRARRLGRCGCRDASDQQPVLLRPRSGCGQGRRDGAQPGQDRRAVVASADRGPSGGCYTWGGSRLPPMKASTNIAMMMAHQWRFGSNGSSSVGVANAALVMGSRDSHTSQYSPEVEAHSRTI